MGSTHTRCAQFQNGEILPLAIVQPTGVERVSGRSKREILLFGWARNACLDGEKSFRAHHSLPLTMQYSPNRSHFPYLSFVFENQQLIEIIQMIVSWFCRIVSVFWKFTYRYIRTISNSASPLTTDEIGVRHPFRKPVVFYINLSNAPKSWLSSLAVCFCGELSHIFISLMNSGPWHGYTYWVYKNIHDTGVHTLNNVTISNVTEW